MLVDLHAAAYAGKWLQLRVGRVKLELGVWLVVVGQGGMAVANARGPVECFEPSLFAGVESHCRSHEVGYFILFESVWWIGGANGCYV